MAPKGDDEQVDSREYREYTLYMSIYVYQHPSPAVRVLSRVYLGSQYYPSDTISVNPSFQASPEFISDDCLLPEHT